MWVEMMRDAWEHLLSFNFKFLLTLPDLSNIEVAVPAGVVTFHQFLNFFSEFYEKTKHIGRDADVFGLRALSAKVCERNTDNKQSTAQTAKR